MVKLSIIIPIYNGETYLEQCIKSILCQTLKELEVLCVDDGSTDHSSQIIKRFQDEDNRIYLFRQENLGAGVARNLAIKKAQGKYLAFLDSDDYYLDKDALELMFNACEANRISACASLRKRIINGIIEPDPLFQNVIKERVLNYCDYQFDYNYQDFIFLREIIIKNNIYFPQYRRFQDPPFLVKVLHAAKQFMIVDTHLYCYRLVDAAFRFNNAKTCDLLCGLIDNLIFAKEKNLNVLFKNTVKRLEYEYTYIIIKNILPDDLHIIKLLMRANHIICSQMKSFNYIIRPLRIVLLYIDQYEKKLMQEINEYDEIVLYGAGRYGQAFLEFLQWNGCLEKVSYIVVSDLKGNLSQIKNISVITLRDLQKIGEKPMLVAVGEQLQSEVEDYLSRNQYCQYEIIKDEFLYMISEEIYYKGGA